MHGTHATPSSTNQYAMERRTPHFETSNWPNLCAPHPQLPHRHPTIPTPILIPPSWLPRELRLPPHPWIHPSVHTHQLTLASFITDTNDLPTSHADPCPMPAHALPKPVPRSYYSSHSHLSVPRHTSYWHPCCHSWHSFHKNPTHGLFGR